MYHEQTTLPEQGSLAATLPDAVVQYLAHTGVGVPIRELARLSDCHASTVSRRVARTEQHRDDPLFDAALRKMENWISGGGSDLQQRLKGEMCSMNQLHGEFSMKPKIDNFEQEAMRVLRRLCETGAVLAIAADMDMAVVVREGADGATTRTAVVSQDVTEGLSLEGWIETSSKGRVLRYTITQSGRDAVREMIEASGQGAPRALSPGMAEAPAGFDMSGSDLVPAGANSPATPVGKTRYNLAESPLTALARRKDKTGAPFLSEDLVRCGERLREDFELAQMDTSANTNWNELVEGQASAPTPKRVNGPDAARARVVAALKDLGPGLSDVTLRCCCYLEGLETTEQQMGWSARSGKIVLRIALQRLKRHYQENLTEESQLIG